MCFSFQFQWHWFWGYTVQWIYSLALIAQFSLLRIHYLWSILRSQDDTPEPCISLSFAVVFGVGSEFWLLIPGRAIRWGKYWAYSIWTLRGSTLWCCNYLVSNSQNLSPSWSSQGMSFHFVLGHVYKIQGNGRTINYSLFATGMDIPIKWRFSNKYFVQCELHEFIFSNSYNCPRYWKIFRELLPLLLSVIATNINYLLEGIYRSSRLC